MCEVVFYVSLCVSACLFRFGLGRLNGPKRRKATSKDVRLIGELVFTLILLRFWLVEGFAWGFPRTPPGPGLGQRTGYVPFLGALLRLTDVATRASFRFPPPPATILAHL